MIPGSVWTVISIVNYAAVLVTILQILQTRRDPRGMLVWILTLLLLPVLGLLLFLLVGRVPIQRKIRRRKRRRRKIEPGLAEQTAILAKAHDAREHPQIDDIQRDLMQLATRVSHAVVTTGNRVEVFHDAERAFLTLSLAIESARQHVHMAYYIFADDETGCAMRDLLVKKTREGVEVRLLVDAVGSWKLSRSFVRSLRDGGVKIEFFLPWGFTRRRFQLNCRNHRKLTVVDGAMGFLGSKNIADEYLGRKSKLGPWRDTHLRATGPCITQLQEVFVEDWHFATEEDLVDERYFPEPTRTGDHLVQIVASGPDREAGMLHQLLLAGVSAARKTVSVLTPYFVPDSAMMLALTSAAYRGVRVQLLLPSRSDHWFVLWAGRSFYEELLQAGVGIYEYSRGMLHSKEVIVDGRWALVGSANMDVRSFRLNFELSGILYDEALAHFLQSNFDALRDDSTRVLVRDVKQWNHGQNLAAGLARLASPIL